MEAILSVAGLSPLTVTEAWQQLMTALVDSHDLDGKCDRVRELMGHIRTRKEEMARSVCSLYVLFCTVQVWPMCRQNHVACNVSFNTNCSSCSYIVSRVIIFACELYHVSKH